VEPTRRPVLIWCHHKEESAQAEQNTECQTARQRFKSSTSPMTETLGDRSRLCERPLARDLYVCVDGIADGRDRDSPPASHDRHFSPDVLRRRCVHLSAARRRQLDRDESVAETVLRYARALDLRARCDRLRAHLER